MLTQCPLEHWKLDDGQSVVIQKALTAALNGIICLRMACTRFVRVIPLFVKDTSNAHCTKQQLNDMGMKEF